MDIKTNSFGEFIQDLRIKEGIGSRELSKLINKGSSYISQVEKGRNKNPDYRTAWTILKVLKINEIDRDSTLERFNIFKPDGLEDIDFKEELSSFIQEYKTSVPKTVVFSKSKADAEDSFKNRIVQISNMLNTIYDYNPKEAKPIIENMHQVIEDSAQKIIAKRTIDLMNEADLKTLTTLGQQLEEDLRKRGLEHLIGRNDD